MGMAEVDRLGVIKKVVEKRLRQRQAAKQLGVGVRQVKRLVKRYRKQGALGLVSRRRGRSPNNTISADRRQEMLDLIHAHYTDFGPTLACEKLVEKHGHTVSKETLRRWMIAEGLWKPKSRKVLSVHQSRPRRACRGELVQIDGSPHAWFETRGPVCTLILFVDDATSALLAARFYPAETTRAYMEVLRAHLACCGRPVAYYSDRHSIFRVNQAGREGELTQFSRALKTLDIESIHAHSAQAKGRVERANQTLQDRLVKEMRLRGINDLEAGNAYLPTFLADYNRRFAKAPRNPQDAHRKVLHDARELDLILCEQHPRKVSKNLAIRFRCREYQLQGVGKGRRLQGAQVTMCASFDGGVTILHGGKVLPARPAYKPTVDHPWKKMTRQAVAVAGERAAGPCPRGSVGLRWKDKRGHF